MNANRNFYLRGGSVEPPPAPVRCTQCDDTGWVPSSAGGVEPCPHVKAKAPAPAVHAPAPRAAEADGDDVGVLSRYLRRHALGRSNAKTAKALEVAPELRQLLGKDFARALRSVTAEAVQRLVPIVSGDDGYFYATDPAEFDGQIGKLNAQLDHVRDRVSRLKMMQQYMRDARDGGSHDE